MPNRHAMKSLEFPACLLRLWQATNRRSIGCVLPPGDS